ncbi:MAG: NFACT RNA binding domain-containing protein [Candidatus Cloacimonetes bacterium]|nr:NFACT RNA binding domain-containing protein [Candidatus Cloacimonadota bacterium]
MDYKYLKEWVKTAMFEEWQFKSIQRFEDQFFISFKKINKLLQINLSSENSFVFFTVSQNFLKEHSEEIVSFNQHLSSCRLRGIYIVNNDRIISLHFNKKDIYGQNCDYALIIELIPRYQNIILTRISDINNVSAESFQNKTYNSILQNLPEMTIVESLKKISYAENQTRQILPGIIYQPPFTINKSNDDTVVYPLTTDEKYLKIAEDSADGFQSINDVMDRLFYKGILQRRTDDLIKQKSKQFKKEISKKEKKINRLLEEKNDASQADCWLERAELIKSNLNLVKQGEKEVTVTNYYSPDLAKVSIPLQADKSPIENMNFYYKKYRKAKSGKLMIEKQIEIAYAEIEKLEIEIFELENFDNYLLLKKIRPVPTVSNSDKEHKSFKKITVNSDWEIFIGRTSKENDILTTKFAKPEDWWFHSRVFRGTHVILRNYKKIQPPDQLINICCNLAAYFSKAKNSINVPVDYTQIRYVRKPKGSAAGFVTYKNQKSVYANPVSMREAALLITRLYEENSQN